MTTLEDLYYGNISPHERYIKKGTRVDRLVKLICKNEEELNSGLTEKQKKPLKSSKTAQANYPASPSAKRSVRDLAKVQLKLMKTVCLHTNNRRKLRRIKPPFFISFYLLVLFSFKMS